MPLWRFPEDSVLIGLLSADRDNQKGGGKKSFRVFFQRSKTRSLVLPTFRFVMLFFPQQSAPQISFSIPFASLQAFGCVNIEYIAGVKYSMDVKFNVDVKYNVHVQYKVDVKYNISVKYNVDVKCRTKI